MRNKVNHSIEASIKFCFSKGDFNKISSIISNVDWVNSFEKLNVQEMYDELMFHITIASNEFIPLVNTSEIKHQASPWINTDLKSLIRSK